jgi:Uma2 family endonuclease
MATITAATERDDVYRFSVHQYQQICSAGIIPEDERVELLQGVIYPKMTKNPDHILATELVQQVLSQLVGPGWFVSMQNPVEIESDDSQPEPDAKVVRGDPRDYAGRHVGPHDLALVVEVADTSHRRDLEKRGRYATAAIPYYWIINLNSREVEAYWGPTEAEEQAATYRESQVFDEAAVLPLVLDGREVAQVLVRDLLP